MIIAEVLYEATRGLPCSPYYKNNSWTASTNVVRNTRNQFARNYYCTDGSIFIAYKKGGVAWCKPNGQMMARRTQ